MKQGTYVQEIQRLLDNIKKVRSCPRLARAELVLMVEGNLSWVRSNTICAAVTNESANTILLSEAKNDNTGLWTTHRDKERMTELASEYLPSELKLIIPLLTEGSTTTKEGDKVREMLKNQFHNFKRSVQHTAATSTMIFSGKDSGSPDDLAVSLMLGVMHAKAFQCNVDRISRRTIGEQAIYIAEAVREDDG
jgi:hypothetical protein